MNRLGEQGPASVGEVITDEELRHNHDFVMAPEAIRKRHGYREMSDAALQDASAPIGVSYEDLRFARHLRNALAYGDAVNRVMLERM